MQGKGMIQIQLEPPHRIHVYDAGDGRKPGGFRIRNSHDERVGHRVHTVQNLRLGGFESQSHGTLLGAKLCSPLLCGYATDSRSASVSRHMDSNRLTSHFNDVVIWNSRRGKTRDKCNELNPSGIHHA